MSLNRDLRHWDREKHDPRSHTKRHEANLTKSLRVTFVSFRVASWIISACVPILWFDLGWQSGGIMFRRLALAVFVLVGVAQCAGAQSNVFQTQVRYLSGTGKDDAVTGISSAPADGGAARGRRFQCPPNGSSRASAVTTSGALTTRRRTRSQTSRGSIAGSSTFRLNWKGKVVRLVFDGVMTDAEVRVNGQTAGPVAPRLFLPIQVRHHAALEIR